MNFKRGAEPAATNSNPESLAKAHKSGKGKVFQKGSRYTPKKSGILGPRTPRNRALARAKPPQEKGRNKKKMEQKRAAFRKNKSNKPKA